MFATNGVPSGWPEGRRKFQNRLENRAAKGSRKERPGQTGCEATVIVIGPSDVLLTGSAYDFTRGLGFYLRPSLACRAASECPPRRCSFHSPPFRPATPSRRPGYRSESEPAWAEVGAARRARVSDILLTQDAYKIEPGWACRAEPGSGVGDVPPRPGAAPSSALRRVRHRWRFRFPT
jgi:hypothetical protein